MQFRTCHPHNQSGSTIRKGIMVNKDTVKTELLFIKMLRDMNKSRAAYLISIAIVAIGFCGYCVLSIATDQMMEARDFFYKATNFCHGFAMVSSAPASMAKGLEQIEGVEAVQARISKTVRVDFGDNSEAQLLLISTSRDGLNLPYLSQGSLPSASGRELVLGDGFSKAHRLFSGGTIDLVIQGSSVPFQIAGSGISPENIYLVKDITQMLPNTAEFDAAFVDYAVMERLFSMSGMANEFVFTLEEGAEFETIKPQIEDLLEPYGCYQVSDLDGNLSCSMLQTELDQLDRVTGAIPFLFLMVAAVILYIALHRMVEQQRTQIGTLMALGLRQRTICFHYMGYGIFVGFAGGLLGGIMGSLCAKPLVSFYMVYFSLPRIPHSLSFSYLIMGAAMSTVFCGGLGWLCARKLWKLTPAQALRPAAPPDARQSPLERLPAFAALFTEAGIMAVRSVFRNRKRSFISLFGIACAFMMIASLVSMNSLIDVFLFDFYEKTQKQDVTIYFSQPVLMEDARQMLRPYLIDKAEYIMALPSTLKSTVNGKSLDSTLQTLEAGSSLCLLYDEAGAPVLTEPGGIVLSVHMAEQLGLKTGDWVVVEMPGKDKKTGRFQISGLSTQYLGSTAYLQPKDLSRLTDYYDACTSILVKAPPSSIEKMRSGLDDVKYVSSIDSRTKVIDTFRSMMGSINMMMGSMAGLGVLIGFSVIYTSSLISFEELKREIATLLMLGMKSKECLDVISTGQWLLTVGGVALGIPMTLWASSAMASSLGTDLYSIPDFVDGWSILFSIGLTFLAVALSSAAIHRKLKKISAVDLLRERE